MARRQAVKLPVLTFTASSSRLSLLAVLTKQEKKALRFLRICLSQMQQMLESLKADLNAALQAAARSLPPPPCGCGWRLPEPVARCSSRGGVWMSRAFSSASPGPGEGTWPLYYSALAAFALLPPSCSVGSAISAAMTAAAAAATRQVLCAFVPADAAAFSEAEADGLEAQRACARILLCSESGDHSAAAAAAIAADAATALPSPKGLAASVDAADAAACFMTLLGVHYDFLMGASSLMRWHASEALRLLAQVKAERCSSHNRYSERPLAETGELGLLGGCHSGVASYGALVDRKEQLDTGGASPRSDIEFKGTYELAATATQRLRGLPSSLRMALFLLQVRKQFLCQRSSLWQHLQQQTAEVLEQLDLGIEGPTAVNDCLSLMHAVQVFVAIGESFVASEDTAAESQLAAEAAAAAATVAAADKTTTHDMGSQPFGEETDGDSAAAAAVAADAVAAAAAATAAGGNTESNMQGIPSNPAAGRLSQVLVVRVLAAIESLHETHIQQMLQHVRAETWQRLPILRRFPLVLLRTSSPVGALPVLPEGISPSTLAAETFGSVAQEGGANAVCGRCGEAVATYGAPNPFAHWQPGMPFVGPGPQAPPQKETADVELAAIEEELRAAEACGRRTDEPPVAVAASQAASRAFMQYWQLAVSAPEVAATAVRAMVRLMGFYVAAVAASVLPEETCSCLAAAPMQGSPYGEVNSRSKVTAIADAATLRCRLPHLHWLLSQTGRDLERLQKKLLRGSSTGTNEIGSGHSGVGARTQLPLLCELIRPMAKLASPGALWGLAERVAAVESARDLLEALAQQLHLQGLPQDFGGSGELRVGQEQQRQQLAGHGASRRLLCSLPREEQQQLWRLLAATRCGIVDLRALVYRLAAGSLCQSSAFTASFQQAATESGVNWSVAVAARDYDPVSAATRPRASDAIPRAYAAAVQQHRRQVADLFWKIRCAGSGSIPADVQLIIWRAVRSQTIADAIDVLSAVPLAADSVERCLNPGPLVAIAEALREIIAEAGLQYGKAAAASGTTSPEQGRSHPLKVVRSNATAADGATDRPHCNDSSGESPLDLDEADFDCFVDVCSRTAPEVMQWCQAQRDRTFGPQGDGKGRAPPLRVMSQMLQRLENQGLLQRGQTAEFENRQSLALMQLTQPPH